jgi:DNA topoisomerase I
VPKDRDPASLTLEECQALLAAAPERKGRFGRRAKPAAKVDEGTTAEAAATAPPAPARGGRKGAKAGTKPRAKAPKKAAAAKKKKKAAPDAATPRDRAAGE